LFGFTAQISLAPQPRPRRRNLLKLFSWLLLAFSTAVVVALFASVIHNAK